MKTFALTIRSVIFTLIIMITMILQPLLAQDELDRNDMIDMIERNVVPTVQKIEVSGTPYFSENFLKGYFELFNGSRTKELILNYNIYENRLEYRDAGQTYAVSPNSVRHFRIEDNGETYVFKKGFESRRLGADEFVEVATEGAISFLIKHEVSFNENSSSGYGSATKKSAYSKNKRFYFKKNGDVIYLKKLNNRQVLRHFDGNQEVENYIKENNLSMSDPEHLEKAVKKYNSVKS